MSDAEIKDLHELALRLRDTRTATAADLRGLASSLVRTCLEIVRLQTAVAEKHTGKVVARIEAMKRRKAMARALEPGRN